MNVYYGLENISFEGLSVFDWDDDLIITDQCPPETIEAIPLLLIKPFKTSSLFEDYGFFSESGKCYLYHDMICAVSIKDGNQNQIDLFLLQAKEELIAVENETNPVYFFSGYNKPLIQKWASAYEVTLEFILL
ncbi:hypothetical protein [Fictibacillus phosphorivorans]|uniref:hypothetical protein n=1 Tax=Fictibacillus phosphorivorans TaxID=1221500 RepID=UPI0020407F60|nr:hypothetical protein [Fictibacillus phosphorivorans]MCM3716800.1 hypothetical protein [Fictibacillus phosphorivorans]MCM3774651.1 hypothetical protein [Fictibacillus phosphorivorans]